MLIFYLCNLIFFLFEFASIILLTDQNKKKVINEIVNKCFNNENIKEICFL